MSFCLLIWDGTKCHVTEDFLADLFGKELMSRLFARCALLMYTWSSRNNQLNGFMKNIRQIRFFIRESMSYISR
jgi:hypothetical protein